MRENLKKRRERLRFFSRPILVAALTELVGNLVIDLLTSTLALPPSLRAWLWMPLLCYPMAVLLVDLTKAEPPHCSMTHAIFFLTSLYPATFRTVALERFVFESVDGWAGEGVAGLVTVTVHLALFTALLAIGKLALGLVAAPNTRASYLFPFQFFDFVQFYVYFGLRSATEPITPLWVVVQVLVQANAVARNSGMADAYTRRLLKWLMRRVASRCGCADNHKLVAYASSDDPIFLLQAR